MASTTALAHASKLRQFRPHRRHEGPSPAHPGQKQLQDELDPLLRDLRRADESAAGRLLEGEQEVATFEREAKARHAKAVPPSSIVQVEGNEGTEGQEAAGPGEEPAGVAVAPAGG